MKQVPASIHEALVEKHFARDPATLELTDDAEIAALRDATRKYRETCEAALDATQKILGNAMQTTARNASEARKNNSRLLDAATDRAVAAETKARKAVAEIEKLIAAPAAPKDPANLQLESEIRQRLSAMPDDARHKAIMKAIDDGDDLIVGAVLRAPEFLTGIGPAEKEAKRAVWQRKRFPDQVDRLGRLQKALVAFGRCPMLANNFVQSLTDNSTIELAEASERAARQAVGLDAAT